jgi:hypothetical protein
MARKSQRLSSSIKERPAHKRAASNSAVSAPSTKRSKKGTAPKQTPTRSQYFKDGSDGEMDLDEHSESDDEDASEFVDDDEDSPPAEDEEDEDDYDSEDKPKRSMKSTSKGSTTASTAVRRPGVEVVFKKPKPRPAGKTPYEDATIHPNTLLFLADLKANNNRQWLKSKCATLLKKGDTPFRAVLHRSLRIHRYFGMVQSQAPFAHAGMSPQDL